MAVIYGPDGIPLAPSNSNVTTDVGEEPTNNNWLKWAQRYVEGVANPDKIKISDYERMDQTDETVFSSAEILIQTILSRLGDYTHHVEQIQDWVRQNFEQMEGNFIRCCREILSGIKYGFSDTEILWRVGPDGRDWLKGLQTIHPDTIMLDVHQVGPNKNKLRVVKQFWRQGQDEAILPVHKLIHYAHDSNFGNLYGCSRYKRAYKNWLIKDVLLKVWCTTLERYGCPLAISTVQNPSAKVKLPEEMGGQIVSAAQYMSRVLDTMAASGSLCVPAGVTVEMVTAATALGKDFLDAINYLNRSIQLAIGLPSLITDAGTVGSQSLGQEHSKTFNQLMVEILRELTEVLLEQLVRRLLEANFPPEAYDNNFGSFQTEEFDVELALKFAQILAILKKTGLVTLEKLDEVNHFRMQQGLPLWTEEDLRAHLDSMDDFPEVDEEGNPLVDPEEEDENDEDEEPARNPDRHSVSYAGRRRNQLRAQAELYANILREKRRRKAA